MRHRNLEILKRSFFRGRGDKKGSRTRMIWYGLVLFGRVWYGLVWFGMGGGGGYEFIDVEISTLFTSEKPSGWWWWRHAIIESSSRSRSLRDLK